MFPWILKDYSSPSLDLTDPNVYRDLTKVKNRIMIVMKLCSCELSDFHTMFLQPMGAVNPSRLRQFEERFDSFEDDSLPPFYYGTHYSTMAFVLHWLVRVVRLDNLSISVLTERQIAIQSLFKLFVFPIPQEPYASMHIAFHDGVFDHGSRLFSAMHYSWHNSTEDSSDVNVSHTFTLFLTTIIDNVYSIRS